MRFSVLLPTREGGALLDDCVRSVLESDRDDLELVIADNANTDETAEVIERHRADPRVVVTRSTGILPVTENWRAALDRSSGEYVVLLNDDDLLLPDYFTRADALLCGDGDPDCMTVSGFYFIFPDAAIDDERSWFRDPAFPGEGENRHRSIAPAERRERLGRMFGDFGFGHCLPGLQRTLVSRRAIDRLPHGLFQPPYPDLYALGALFLTAETWSISPEKLIVFGAGARSFWHLHFSGRGEEAVAYLRNEEPAARLPGDETLNTMALTLGRLKADFPAELEGIDTNERLYVARQVWSWVRQSRAGRISRGELFARLRSLSRGDRRRLAAAPLSAATWRVGAASAKAHARGEGILRSEGFQPLTGISNIREFADWKATHA